MSDEFKAKFERKASLIDSENSNYIYAYKQGAMSVYPILSELVAYVEKDAKAYAQTRYDSDLHLGGQSLAEDLMSKLNDWLECKDER